MAYMSNQVCQTFHSVQYIGQHFFQISYYYTRNTRSIWDFCNKSFLKDTVSGSCLQLSNVTCLCEGDRRADNDNLQR